MNLKVSVKNVRLAWPENERYNATHFSCDTWTRQRNAKKTRREPIHRYSGTTRPCDIATARKPLMGRVYRFVSRFLYHWFFIHYLKIVVFLTSPKHANLKFGKVCYGEKTIHWFESDGKNQWHSINFSTNTICFCPFFFLLMNKYHAPYHLELVLITFLSKRSYYTCRQTKCLRKNLRINIPTLKIPNTAKVVGS